MKIFSWMHKRFHLNTEKDGFASNMKKTEPTTNNVDSFIGGWEDGILTIGTFGFVPLKSINHKNEYFALENELGEQDECKEQDIQANDDDDDGNSYNNTEMEELNPLMHNTFKHNFEDVAVSANHDANIEEMVSTFNEIVMASPVISYEIMESNDSDGEADEKKKGERITLADLFLADSDVKMKLDPAKVLLKSSEKSSFKAKHGLSFAKKFIPHVKDNPRPMKDIKKLMKKMLKRKIHPDLDVKNHKPEGQEVTAAAIIDDHMNEASNDSTYFIPI
ncbi:hypothetical protein Lal_00024942 [Lupinus albus]|uniref:Protein TILLER ANGLE CONTROL 1 n=1 Tax=Lupinus albus TaxID=3870 RepID=A0A6A4PVQ6_LUPAL|nr:hypothetical protein Lalb_Chr10g0100741 [Lupinus albus]KAF1889615.1 hypothetical protein Lal_00024942 [Lupinus albus]